jgi:hypothetical protein
MPGAQLSAVDSEIFSRNNPEKIQVAHLKKFQLRAVSLY